MRTQSYIVLSALVLCTGAVGTPTATAVVMPTATKTLDPNAVSQTAVVMPSTTKAVVMPTATKAVVEPTATRQATATMPVIPTPTLVPFPDDVAVCEADTTCRSFEDSAAKCVAGKCQCSGTDNSPFCSGSTPLATIRVASVVVSYTYTCDAFFTSESLQATVTAALSKAIEAFEGPKHVAVLCGSVNAVATAQVPLSQMSQFTDSVVKQLDNAVTGTALEDVSKSVRLQLNSNSECRAPVPPELVLVKGANGCVPSECMEGYEPRHLGDTTVCVSTATASASDDDLSGGAIAGIVIACLVVIILVVVLLFFAKGKAAKDEDAHEPTA